MLPQQNTFINIKRRIHFNILLQSIYCSTRRDISSYSPFPFFSYKRSNFGVEASCVNTALNLSQTRTQFKKRIVRSYLRQLNHDAAVVVCFKETQKGGRLETSQTIACRCTWLCLLGGTYDRKDRHGEDALLTLLLCAHTPTRPHDTVCQSQVPFGASCPRFAYTYRKR